MPGAITATAAANAIQPDEPDHDTVIRTNDPTRRRRLILAINRGLESVCGREHCARWGTLLGETPNRVETSC